VRDGPLRRAVKALALFRYQADLAFTRFIMRLQGRSRFRLVGSCQGCGRCCEKPSMPVGVLVFRLRSCRWLFLRWHELVNGFEFVAEDREERIFEFRCRHFDPETRRCDSYESRPGMCRDYPRNLLDATRPALFSECGFRALDQAAQGLRSALEAEEFDDAQRRELYEQLYLEEGEPEL